MALPPLAVIATAATAATLIMDTAKRIVDVPLRVATKVSDRVSKIESNTSLSLTGYTKQATLRSRVYIDGALANEPIIPQVIRSIHTMYAGLILTALQLNQFVTSGKTVQDFVGTVATEAFDEPYHDVRSDLEDLLVGLEVLSADEAKKKINDVMNDPQYELHDVAKEAERRQKESLKTLGIPPKPSAADVKTISEVRVAPPEIASVGKLIEVTLTNPDNPGASAKLTLIVQMVPYLIPSKLAYLFICKDTRLSFSQRVLQWKAGEISFFRDLLFQVDQINKSYEIAKNDPSKLFYDFMAQVAKKDRALVTKHLSQTDASKSHNLANSVMLFTNETVERAKAESGIDLHNKAARQRYFNDTYAMVIVVVDTLYNQVTMYFNGIDDVGVYSFSAFDDKSGKDSGLDLIKALAQFTGGKAPRF